MENELHFDRTITARSAFSDKPEEHIESDLIKNDEEGDKKNPCIVSVDRARGLGWGSYGCPTGKDKHLSRGLDRLQQERQKGHLRGSEGRYKCADRKPTGPD